MCAYEFDRIDEKHPARRNVPCVFRPPFGRESPFNLTLLRVYTTKDRYATHTHTCTGERNQLISLTRWPSVERVLGRRWYVGSLQFAAMQGLMQGEGGSPERGKNTD